MALSGRRGNSVAVSVAGVEETIRAMAALPGWIARKHLIRALNSAAKPTKQALAANVSGIGTVTGNLKRAVASRSVLYPSGVAAAVVGFQRAGTSKSRKSGGKVRFGRDRAFHSHLVEFGSQPRRPLNMLGRELQRSARGRRDRAALERAGLGDSVRRDYGMLSSFGSRGDLHPFVVTISPRGLRQVAGMPALRPMQRAFASTASAAAAKLEQELGKALQRAVQENASLSSDYYGGA